MALWTFIAPPALQSLEPAKNRKNKKRNRKNGNAKNGDVFFGEFVGEWGKKTLFLLENLGGKKRKVLIYYKN